MPSSATLLAMLDDCSQAPCCLSRAPTSPGCLTSRAPVRAREIALRLAIGAGRPRVIRQLVTESLLIAMLGGVLGLGVGYAGVTLFRQVQIPTDLPIAFRFELDRRALLFSLIVALVSAVLFGLAPAIRATRADLTSVMKATDAAGFGRRRRWGRAWLVGGTGGRLGSLARGGHVHVPGLSKDARHRSRLPHRSSPDDELQSRPRALHGVAGAAVFEQVAERARSVPGVKSVALDLVRSDAHRSCWWVHDSARRLSVPGWQGQRYGLGFERK